MKATILAIMLTIAAVVAIALCTGCAAEKTHLSNKEMVAILAATPQVVSGPVATPTRARVKPQARHGFNLKASIAKWCEDQKMVTQGNGPSTEAWIYALFQVESDLNPAAQGPGGEYGLGQVTPASVKRYGDLLVKQGHKRGSIDDPDWQVALAVCELKQKDTRGIAIAVRRYNGRGARARAHLAKVKKQLRQLRRGK